MHKRLTELVEQVLSVMPTPEVVSFHAEVFHTAEDVLILCEIASRTGGARIPQMIQFTYGFEMDRYVARAQCRTIDPMPRRKDPLLLTAHFYIPPRNGTLKSFPSELPYEWVLEYKRNAQAEQVFDGPQRSCDHYAFVEVVGTSETELQDRIEQAVRYVEEHTDWDLLCTN